MKREEAQLRTIYDRTEGQCHICRKRLSFRNYALFGKRGGWEIEHSVAQARGGTDHGNNLFAAHISCNRSKGDWSSRTARRQHGYQCAPYSARKKKRNAAIGAGIGSLALFLVPPQFRVAAAVVGAVAGAVAGYKKKPK
ncbi:MAG TPA: HNH endonuclease signature motif containing protein [Burkholderiales bacterium]|nr:HNH endonuclease signature motif containing protein [Burkholderiales bacterium]